MLTIVVSTTATKDAVASSARAHPRFGSTSLTVTADSDNLGIVGGLDRLNVPGGAGVRERPGTAE